MSLLVLPSGATPIALRRDVERRVAVERDVRGEVLRLYDTHAPVVLRYVRSSGVTPDAADDIVQDAFVALFQHLCRGGDARNLRGWLMRVGYRLAVKHRRREWRRVRWQGPWHAEASRVADPAAGPEAVCGAGQAHRRLRAVLRALPERDRQCVCLRAEGLPYREIAQVLGVSLGAVAKSLARAAGRCAAALDR